MFTFARLATSDERQATCDSYKRQEVFTLKLQAIKYIYLTLNDDNYLNIQPNLTIEVSKCSSLPTESNDTKHSYQYVTYSKLNWNIYI